mmetsp:Transcript_115535/g.326591  ORF Transcript_115535/g.326591 Transcript_115535/m.326591 type:complete len:234 (-) Transcript_115535:218-919(-)
MPDGLTFVPLEEAARMSGLRVTFIPGLPAVYSECLKNVLDYKKVPYTRVLHPPFKPGSESQEFLYMLTAQRSLPTMLYNDERPRNSWIEQVVLADKLGEGPSLIPSLGEDRVLMFGLMSELLGEDGLIWRKRLLFGKGPFTEKYGYTDSAAAEAPAKLAESLRLFVERLEKQKKAGWKPLHDRQLPQCPRHLFCDCPLLLLPSRAGHDSDHGREQGDAQTASNKPSGGSGYSG